MEFENSRPDRGGSAGETEDRRGVPTPGQGTHKINAAYSYGGVPLAVQTV